jgi:hypothetical protein
VEFSYAYRGATEVRSGADRTEMSFAPDTKRQPTFFVGELRQSVAFREAVSALHDVVVSDLRFKPKDKTAYKDWAAQREQQLIDEAAIGAQRAEVARLMEQLRAEHAKLLAESARRQSGYQRARRAYFDYLYQKDRDTWFVLDPVITVHPDEIFFECFSQDESSYGRLGASYEVFKEVGEFACGTTNIDYSAALYDEFQKIRSYKTTRLEVDPTGFDVATQGAESYREVKIELPDSWVRGFLQVNSAMSLPARSFDLHPLDVHNLCFVLRRHKERRSPRGMRYLLRPGEPVRVVFEPWEIVVDCPRSIYGGESADEVRVWGRRRLLILERLLPVARRFTVHLLGKGMPSFWVADLGDLSFTLGLSGWTANDWAAAGNFDLMAPRAEVDELTLRRVFDALGARWYADADELARELGLERATVLGALGIYCQAGRAIYDLTKRVYRRRELSREPLPVERLRWANPREEHARRFLAERAVRVLRANEPERGIVELSGIVEHGREAERPSLVLDADERMLRAQCSCGWYRQHKLFKGPCEHILALRLYAAQSAPRAATATAKGPSAQPPSHSPTPQAQAPVPARPRALRREELLDAALARALDHLVERGLLELRGRSARVALGEQLLAEALKAWSVDDMVRRVLAVLVEADEVEEVFGDDEEIAAVLREALAAVQQMS